jgi:hypothetical protein
LLSGRENDDLCADGGSLAAGRGEENAPHVIAPTWHILDLQFRRARRVGAIQLNMAAAVVLAGFCDDLERRVVGIGVPRGCEW